MSGLSSESTISHYRIKELLGRGGMGEVYKAVDTQLGRIVALKTLPAAKIADEDAQRRFLREARAASILSHPSICTIFEVGQENGLDFIAMQFVQGETIQTMLSHGSMALESTLAYALDIADALDEAHKNGVIHRDVKPSNIIVNERGVAVVLDFGLAKQVFGSGEHAEDIPTLLQVSTATTIAGTMPYMSPEQIRGETLDARSDIFSFGVTLYEMLAGRLPFNGATNIDVLHSILHDEPQSVRTLRPEAGNEVDSIIEKALKKDRADRYQTIAEMRSDLVLYAHQKGIAIKGVSSAPTGGSLSAAQTRMISSETLPRARLRKFTSVVSRRHMTILFIAALLVVVVWWFFVRPQNKSEIDLSTLQTVQLVDWKSEAGEGYAGGKFSHDGKRIAFASTKNGGRHIWIEQIGDKNAAQLTSGDSLDRSPIWSPDDSQIAFVSTRGDQTGIWIVSAIGGPPRSVAILNSDVNPLRWSRDGKTIYYYSQKTVGTLDAQSGQTNTLIQFDSFSPSVQFVSLSPDEDRVLFIDDKNEQRDVWIAPIKGGEPIQLTNDAAEDRDPVWHPDGRRIIYSSDRNGIYQLLVAYPGGRRAQQITFGASDSFASDISVDGSKILYATTREESDIWRVDTNTGDESEITSDVVVEVWPDVSPDGKAIAFQASKQSQGILTDSSILIKPVQPQGPEVQVASDGREPLWSPDGKTIAFLRFANSKYNLWTIMASGGDERQLTTRDVWRAGFQLLPYNLSQVSDFAWSPDGSKIIYTTDPGEANIWIVSVNDLSEVKVLSSDLHNSRLYCPFWSPDGSRIACLSEPLKAGTGGKRVWTITITSIDSGQTETILQSPSFLRLVGWSRSGTEVITVLQDKLRDAGVHDVTLIQVSAHDKSQEIARLESVYRYNIRLSRDRRTIAFVSRQNGKDNVWLIPITGGEAKMITTNTDPKLYFSSMTWSPDGKAVYFGKQSRYSLLMMLNNLK